MDGSARLAALGTPTDISVQMNLDRQMVGALLDASTDAAMGNGNRDGHASQHGKLSLSRHRPESIGRHPRKVSKSHESGSIPTSVPAPPAPEDPTPLDTMLHRLTMPEGRALYARRRHTPEPVFGIIKSVLGFRQFSLRGLAGARGEWSLDTMAWNVKRMFNLAQVAA